MNATVGYLTKRFPRLSETFILDEILGLERVGVPLRLYALAHPHEAIEQPDTSRLRTTVTYLRDDSSWRSAIANLRKPAAAHLHLLRTRPGPYARVLLYVAYKRRHWSTVRHLLEAGYLAVLLQRDGASHVHAAFAHGPASVAHFVHLLTGLPFSFSAHAKDLYESAPDLLARKIAAAEFVLVCSESAARVVCELAGPAADKVLLAPHGVDTARFRPTPSGLADTPGEGSYHRPLRLLAVGRLVEKKGYPTLLQAIHTVAGSGGDVTCRIIGAGPLRAELEQLATRLGVSDRIEFLGARTHQEVAAAYHEADAFVQTSVVLSSGDRDGIPNALLEAMASGLPVVASAVGGIPEVIADRATGLLCAPDDPTALAERLILLLDNPSLRRRLGEQARQHIVAHYDRDSAIRAIAPLFGIDAAPLRLVS